MRPRGFVTRLPPFQNLLPQGAYDPSVRFCLAQPARTPRPRPGRTHRNLDRSVSFYSAALGMEVLDCEGRGVRLGDLAMLVAASIVLTVVATGRIERRDLRR